MPSEARETPQKRTLCSILVDCGIVTPDQVDRALARQTETGRLIGQTLVELGFTTEENIGWALSKQLGIPYADVQPQVVDAALATRFPESLLRRVSATPLFKNQDEVVIAMADPTDQSAFAELREAAGGSISVVIGAPAAIARTLDEVCAAGRAHGGGGHYSSATEVTVGDHQTTFLLHHLRAARNKRASEIHFVPSSGGLAVFYRTDRGLEPQGMERLEDSMYLRTRLTRLGASDFETPGEAAAWGSLPIDVEGERIHVGVCHCRTDGGVATVLRMTPAAAEAPDLSSLGLSPLAEAEIRELVDGPEGLVIVHGPPRSGGSTVLASLAALAARPERRLLVLEPSRVAPYPPGSTRVRIQSRGITDSWERLTVGLGADVVVVDDLLEGDEIARVLGGATVGRLVFARTDWLDGHRLLDYLARSRDGRAVLRDRPFAMISLPIARREGSSVWVTASEAESHAGSLDAIILTEEDRDALLARKAR